MNYETWYETYKPIENDFVKGNEEMFETYGEELDFVNSVESNRVWTWLDGGEASVIVNGKYHINRLGYYITEVAHDPEEFIAIVLSEEVECECFSEERLESGLDAGDPDCGECEGSGQKTVYKT